MDGAESAIRGPIRGVIRDTASRLSQFRSAGMSDLIIAACRRSARPVKRGKMRLIGLKGQTARRLECYNRGNGRKFRAKGFFFFKRVEQLQIFSQKSALVFPT